jgi:MYXO-CTERM domain-containing protein
MQIERTAAPVRRRARALRVGAVWLGLCAAWAAAGCSADTAGLTSRDRYTGQLQASVATMVGGTTVKTYYLKQADGNTPRLVFHAEPDLAPGDPIDVWGTAEPDGSIDVESARAALSPGELAVREAALLGAPGLAPRRMAFVLVDMGGTATLTQAQAVERLFADTNTPDTSIARYYIEDSYGVQSLTGDVYGPFSYPPLTTCTNADTDALANTLRAQIPGTYDQYAWYFTSLSEACQAWSGLAQLGTPAHPARDTWLNAAGDCVTLVQEPGHNYGMAHSSAIRCGTDAPITDSLDAGCSHDEYGDPFDPMGHGCYQMNMYQKAYEGWLGGCNSVKVTATGTFDLYPMEDECDGVQVLQVPMPKVRPFTRPSAGGGPGGTTNFAYYYVEYRQQAGNFEKALRGSNVFDGVLIHAGEDYRTAAQDGRHPYLLDMNPATSTMNDAALTVGNTYTDPAGGVSITLVAATADKATVQIKIDGGTGAPVCLDGTTFDATAPRSCGGVAVTSDPPAPQPVGATGGGGNVTGSTPGTGAPPAIAATAESGCACAAAADPAHHAGAGVVALALAAAVARRRRRRC